MLVIKGFEVVFNGLSGLFERTFKQSVFFSDFVRLSDEKSFSVSQDIKEERFPFTWIIPRFFPPSIHSVDNFVTIAFYVAGIIEPANKILKRLTSEKTELKINGIHVHKWQNITSNRFRSILLSAFKQIQFHSKRTLQLPWKK